MANFVKGSKKVLNAWAFYDWANSVYALVISSSIFPLYYGALFRLKGVEAYPIFGHEIRSESIISYVTALGFFIIAIMSPFLSGIADYLGNKKFFLKLFCYIGSVSCMLLYFFSLDYLILSLVFYLLALIGFWGSLVFYNSYLPDIAHTEQQDKISAKGYGLGYIGSVILLLINLAMLMNYEVFGFESEMTAMRFSFLLVGIWWMGFSQYTYKHLPDFKNGKQFTSSVFFSGYKELKTVWKQLGEYATLKRYLKAFFVYSMAVQTVMIIAAYFGEKEVAWGGDQERTMGLIVSILLIQIIAVVGAFLTSRLSALMGNINTLILVNVLWVFICVYAYFVVSPMEFYIAASAVGLVMGGIQSLSRSTYSKLLPETKDTTSFFSFYDVTEKIGIVIGMFLYGLISDLTGKMQNAILFLIVFFILGVFLLFRIPKEGKI
ncbi:MFS transporter [Flavobacterium sp. HSC-61S13]|uniref:MFS transporter n=1 Tax=Flavobacterium sp. HSC-61S13 TaxID=2910963 RepID=UPI00209F7721|nr:MFS transporter [Flavobacterium sp. HSC-61S13]MCP1995746.1 UMF1 family MFS transporter [Flavobacterium sp. HSC-61S13]